MNFGYARVSTTDQNENRQIDSLKEKGIDERLIYVDKHTGATRHRPELTKLLEILHENDVLFITSMDRLCRSRRELYEITDILDKRKVILKSIKESFVDRTTSIGQFFFGVIALVNELERNIILENVKEGYRAGRDRGKKYGPNFKLSPYEIIAMKQEIDKGKRIPDIAKELNVTIQTIYNYLRRNK